MGRYKHRAFAYLLVPGERALSEDAQKRLKALEEFSTLGAGFRIAMRDLEIRGCGDILGSRQHGHIIAVGYDTYTHLLNEAVAELKGESYAPRSLPPVEIAIDAYIPEEYVPSEAQKITLYKRISGARSVEELEELRAELADRFGAPPAPVQRLVNVMRVRVLGVEAGANRIVAARAMLKVEFKSGAQLSRKIRNTVSLEFGNRAEFSWQDTPAITLSLNTETPEDTLRMAEQLLKTVGGTEATFQEASL
ncbi:MAG: hypothetical protein HY706_02840 [Candidatus Hydrogenedentes bacterium]|nr:hypothetical protein [Candidatus Hydrogenedentota bacterium]